MSNPTFELTSVAVHLAMLRTGKVILFSGDHENIWNWTKGESSLWNPEDPYVRSDPKLNRNLFCSGHCLLPDGRLFVAGGQSTFNHPLTIPPSFLGILQLVLRILHKNAADHDIHTFDPDTEKWQLHTQMPRARWYPTCTTLPDGKALIVSGTYSHAHHALGGFINLDYEIFDPATNTLSKPSKFINEIEMYPFLKVLPGGTLFIHSQKTTSFWNIAERKAILDINFQTKKGGTKTYPGMGSCVMLPLEQQSQIARILSVGGSTSMSPDKNTDALNVAEIFTANLENLADSIDWEPTPPMHKKRILCDSVLLPDETVLVTNGAEKGQADDNQTAVKEIEVFEPNSKTWKIIGVLERERLYHSSAVLLPEGQVVVAGSTGHSWLRAAFDPKNFEHEIEVVSPPYLQGNPSRIVIDKVPPSLPYNANFTVETKDASNTHRVSLIRTSSTTHNNNMDQRCIILPILDKTNDTLRLSSPQDSSWAPPGYYMLFLIDENGIPSIAKFTKIG